MHEAMPKADPAWFPPGYKSITDLIDETARELLGTGFTLDLPHDAVPGADAPLVEPEMPLPGSGPATYTLEDLKRSQRENFQRLNWRRWLEEDRAAARKELRTRLAAGKITAFILCPASGPVPLEPKWWWSEDGEAALRTGRAELTTGLVPLGRAFLSVGPRGPVCVQVSTEQPPSSVAAQTRCVEWLREAARSGSYRTKAEYRAGAGAAILKLSVRSFDRAWDQVTAQPGNEYMRASGRKRGLKG